MVWFHRWLSRKIRSSLLSGLCAAGMTLVCSALLIAVIMNSFDFHPLIFTFCIYCCHVAAIVIGTNHVIWRAKKRAIFNGLRVSIAYSFLVGIISFLFFNQPITWFSMFMMMLAMMIGVGSSLWSMRTLK
jgi:putative membrane protein (TIGR04086 family)